MLEEERIIDGRTASPNEENVDRALRPSLLNEYVAVSRSTTFCSSALPAWARRR